MKHIVTDKIESLTAQAEAVTAAEIMNEFKQELFQHFKKRKDHIEDWQDIDGQLNAFKNRLRVIADKEAWTKDNVLDMALISALIWNNK